MRTGVGQSQHRVTSREQFRDFIFDVVEDRHAKARFEIRGQRQVEREVYRIDAALARYFIKVALFERSIAGRVRNHRAIPSVGERTARALARLGLERTPKLRVRVDFLFALEVRRRHRREHAHALENKRRLELELEVQRTASDLRYDAKSLIAKLLRCLERPAMSAGTVHASEQSGISDRTVSVARDLRKLAQEQFASYRC